MNALQRTINGLNWGIQSLISRAVAKAVKYSGKLQYVQVEILAGETKDQVEHYEPYGFTSAVLPDSEALVLFVGGDRSHGITTIITNRRYRPSTLSTGDVCIYTDEGAKVTLKRGKIVEIDATEMIIKGKLTVQGLLTYQDGMSGATTSGKTATITGDIQITGNINAGGQIIDTGGNANHHSH